MRKRGFILILLLHCSLLAIPQSFNVSKDLNRSKTFAGHYEQYVHYPNIQSPESLTLTSASSAPGCKEIDWAVWDSFKENSAIGTINNNGSNISVILNANFSVESASQIERYDVFKRYKAPVLNTAVPRTSWSKEAGGKITICFSQTVKEPVLLLASLGNYKDRIKTTISFSEPYVMLYNGGGMIFDNSNTVTGREGYAIIKFPGDIKCITINSSSYENFTDFTWGISVCPDGTPKPASSIISPAPEIAPAPVAAIAKPVQSVAAATPAPAPKPVIVPKPEPVVPKAERPTPAIIAAVPKTLPMPVQPVVAATPAPTQKPVAAAPITEVKPGPVITAIQEAGPKPVQPVVAASPAVPKPVPAVIPAPINPRPIPIAAVPPAKQVLPIIPKPGSAALIQNINNSAQGRFLKIEVYDFDGMDYDSVSLKLNGRQIGPKAIPLALYKIYGSPEFTYTLELQAGDNTLEVYAISEGIKPFATVGVLIMYDNGRKKYHFALKARESAIIHL